MPQLVLDKDAIFAFSGGRAGLCGWLLDFAFSADFASGSAPTFGKLTGLDLSPIFVMMCL